MDGRLTFPIRFGSIVQPQRVDGAAASRAAEDDFGIDAQFRTDSKAVRGKSFAIGARGNKAGGI